jgi:hypothetical protein
MVAGVATVCKDGPMTTRALNAWLRLVLAGATVAACTGARGDANASRSAKAPFSAPGPAASELLYNPGFEWRTLETTHLRVHTPAGSNVDSRAAMLADSTEAARTVVLGLLGEPLEAAVEPKAEVFFVDSRAEMTRLAGRPIGGFAQPGELTAVFVAGDQYRPFLRHELAHAYASVRWGDLNAGDWLTEGIGALAQGDCQGHTIDELASGYLKRGAVPPLRVVAENFRSYPELPSYVAAASVVDFVRRREGIAAVRALWSARRLSGHPLGADGDAVEAEWRKYLASVPAAVLDTVSLKRAGC